MMIDQVQMQGANSIILSIIVTVIWICWMSLVALVMRDDVWNALISALENDITFLKSLERRSRPTLAPTLAARNDIPAVKTKTMTDIRIIRPPHRHMYEFWIASMSRPAVSSQRAAYWRPMELTFWLSDS